MRPGLRPMGNHPVDVPSRAPGSQGWKEGLKGRKHRAGAQGGPEPSALMAPPAVLPPTRASNRVLYRPSEMALPSPPLPDRSTGVQKGEKTPRGSLAGKMEQETGHAASLRARGQAGLDLSCPQVAWASPSSLGLFPYLCQGTMMGSWGPRGFGGIGCV